MKTTPKTQVIIYKAKDGWRWHMKRSGRIVAESGEGYRSKNTMGRSLMKLVNSFKVENYEFLDK